VCLAVAGSLVWVGVTSYQYWRICRHIRRQAEDVAPTVPIVPRETTLMVGPTPTWRERIHDRRTG
jgi:hypothetical protein